MNNFEFCNEVDKWSGAFCILQKNHKGPHRPDPIELMKLVETAAKVRDELRSNSNENEDRPTA